MTPSRNGRGAPAVREGSALESRTLAPDITIGPQTLGDLAAGANREWLLTDGLGGYAMGTAAGLRTRRYHGLLTVATGPGATRWLGLAALDPVIVHGDARIHLATHRWHDGTVAPRGYRWLSSFTLSAGVVPVWRWQIGDVVLERTIAMLHGRPAVAVVDRLVRAPGPVRLELEALCTWRDAHGERTGPHPLEVEPTSDGVTVEGAYRLSGPDFRPDGTWYEGVRADAEAARGLPAVEDLFLVGRFGCELEPGEHCDVRVWAGDLATPPPSAAEVPRAARERAGGLVRRAAPADEAEALLAVAADRFVVDAAPDRGSAPDSSATSRASPGGGATAPTVIAGYPWFGAWSRDTMISYEGLFLATGRAEEGRALLTSAAEALSEGMLPNTADTGVTEYNTVDATLWFVHAVGRHVAATGDHDLAAHLLPALRAIIDAHREGTRYGIGVDPADGLLRQGAPGVALTWMDARVDGEPVTPRHGKPVEVNALWVAALATVAGLPGQSGEVVHRIEELHDHARASFLRRFVHAGRLCDVVDGPGGDDATLRPNQLLACSLPGAPLAHEPERASSVVAACEATLLTPLGLRSLTPRDHRYEGRHRGGPAERDAAYHQGTVWPWLIGPFADACRGVDRPLDGVLDGLTAHLGDWGLGSVSETADGDAPHDATGCPFQAWSAAEVLRALRGRGDVSHLHERGRPPR